MNFKISFITASLFAALSLSGCNGGSSSTSTSPVDKKPSPDKETPDTSKPDTGTVTIQAIDGYLANAEICIDRNNNSSCDTDEKLTIKTDKNGKAVISKKDAKFNIIVSAKASFTSDSDKSGKLGNDFQYIASASDNVENKTISVTPFTTMAHAKNTTLEALASELNLPLNTIAGDYVAQKESDDNTQKVHAIARSITTTLPTTIAAIDADKLVKTTTDISKILDEKINNKEDLNTINIEFDEKGQAVSKEIYTTASYFAVNEEMWALNLNKAYATLEGIDYVKVISANTLEMTRYNTGKTSTGEFTINGDVFLSDGEADTFIYMTQDVSLAVPQNDGDLIVWSKKDLRNKEAVYAETFANKTFFFIADDSTNYTPDPMFATMRFTTDKVTIEENGESMELSWAIQNDNLFIDFPDGDNDMNFKIIAKDRNLLITEDSTVKNMFGMFASNEAFARDLLTKWKASSK
ncbi:hypothetical protein [Photobacterium angustum]|uniref:hypothetical protein n=1 Tax=Photobacterium angustum TaxID=661 RepID=UPI0005E27437|nr:hypothetical protein [Photobacterium angustum]KJG15613.1 hypothetical protein UA33_18565 [Photobacterium angustum]KJG21040.1 hypothetical protein UA39_18365 [Photobacterium angustum]KJG27895.1 hypothetical protein UA36_18940 [Photobacterium angustum]PSW94354.1 hypothetical protein C0W79_13730 [Photobacterium angustum]PSX03097.1 hypothetical protein C0W87_05745 [Photobacterium angustum]